MTNTAPHPEVVVFGSINSDWVIGVPRLPAPGETVLGRSFEILPGGKGANQALAARKAGARVAMAGAVGDDPFAAAALANLTAAGVDLTRVMRGGADRTGVALIQVDPEGRNTIAVASGANGHARASAVEDAALAPGVVVLMALELALDEVVALARRARERGAFVVVNASPVEAFAAPLLECTDLIVVNEHEAAVLAGHDVDALLERGTRATPGYVVTQGADGAVFGCNRVRGHVPAPRVDVVDTVGAGDAFAGALAAALARGASLPDAIGAAVSAGARACTHAGAQAWP